MTPEPQLEPVACAARESSVDVCRALDLLAQAVEQYGTAHVCTPLWRRQPRYRTCVYAGGGEPSCIVGVALALAGVPVATLEELSDRGVWELYRSGELPIELTLGAAIAFHRAQEAQDAGLPWGAVLDTASRTAVNAVRALAPPALAGDGWVGASGSG